jgi:hypothetical protein
LLAGLLLSSCTTSQDKTGSAGAGTRTTPAPSPGSEAIDDYGDSPDTAAVLPLGQAVSGTFSSQQDKDVFAWLAQEKGAYRVTVVPDGGGQVEAVLSVRDSDGSSFTQIKRAVDSKLVDITIVAQYPALYFPQLRQTSQGKVTNYTVRVEPTEDPSLPPQITSMPTNANTGDTFTIFGRGFGAHPGTLQFGRNTNASVIMWSPSQIIAKVPQGSGTLEVIVKSKAGKTSAPFQFTYGPKLDDQTMQQVRVWAKSQMPDAEKRLKDAEDRMLATYVKAERAYNDLKNTKGTEVFRQLSETYDGVVGPVRTCLDAAGKYFPDILKKRPDALPEADNADLGRFISAAKCYLQIGQWAAMDSVLIARNIRSQWYTWAVLRPAVDEYERANDELNTLRNFAQGVSTPTSKAGGTGNQAASTFELVGAIGPVMAVTTGLVNNRPYLFYSSGATLVVADLSDQASPRTVSRIFLPGTIRSLFYHPSDKMLLVAAGRAGLHFVSVSDPVNPRDIIAAAAPPHSPNTTPGETTTVFADEKYAYALEADGNGSQYLLDDNDGYEVRLRIFDLARTPSPVEITNLGLTGTRRNSLGLFVSQAYAYVKVDDAILILAGCGNKVL